MSGYDILCRIKSTLETITSLQQANLILRLSIYEQVGKKNDIAKIPVDVVERLPLET